MVGNYEKSVKGATKLKLAPPKAKYIEPILQATHTGEAGVGEIFRILQFRLRDSTWTIAFKALIVVHLMMRDGAPGVTLQYVAETSPQKLLAVNNYTDLQTQGKNIRRYSKYLIERARAFGATKHDYVQGASGRMKRLTVDKGLLREAEIIQSQVHALVKCEFFSDDPENEITLTAFRTLVMDLLTLFSCMNEAMINILEHYFEMSKPDAERALAIYKRFCSGTANVVKFLTIARSVEQATRVEIPTIRHAPTSLSATLEDYLHDKDFEVNRRQYLAEKETKRSGGGKTSAPHFTSFSSSSPPSTSKPKFPSPKPSASRLTGHAGPTKSADLIDFFDTIEDKQQTLGQNPQQFFVPSFGANSQQMNAPNESMYQQQMAFQQSQQQHANPYMQHQPQQLNAQYTGAGFGGYGPQPTQDFAQQPMQTGFNTQSAGPFGQAPQQYPMQQQNTNPFGQSPPPQQMQQQQTGFGSPQALAPQQTNPFRHSVMPMGQQSTAGFPYNQLQQSQQSPTHLTASQTGLNPFAHNRQANSNGQQPQQQQFQAGGFPQAQQQQQQYNPPAPMLAQATGTNPFAKAPSSPPPLPVAQQGLAPPGSLLSQATGSTNPFRQSAFVNQQTGQGWQSGPQHTMGGLEQLDTIPVFPRPGQGQQQQQQSPWG